MGRITQHGDAMSVQADLVNTSDGTEIWGSHYDRKLADITQLQSDITHDISNSLRIQLSGNEQQHIGKAGTASAEAYRLYLEGRQQWYGRTPEGLKKSIELFQQAIAADPNYALPYAGLGDTYSVAPSYGVGISWKQARILGDEVTQKALALDNSLPDAHRARAMTLCMQWKWDECDAEFRRVFALNPNDATAHYFYGFTFLVPHKRIDEAITEFHTALSLDPLSSIVNTNYAVVLMDAHRYPEAEAQFKKTLERDPNFSPAHFKLSQLYAFTGNFSNAITEFKKSTFGSPGSWSNDARGYSQMTIAGVDTYDLGASAAMTLVLAGDHDRAFEYLNKTLADCDNELLMGIRYPALDPIRSDPRYAALMKTMGLPD